MIYFITIFPQLKLHISKVREVLSCPDAESAFEYNK